VKKQIITNKMKSLKYLFTLASLAYWNPMACLAQELKGPATLENFLLANEKSNSTEADAQPDRPQGTLNRPKNSIRYPALDKAWAAYDTAVGKVAETIRVTITMQFDSAIARGDLNAAEKWQKAIEQFEKAGELPTETEIKSAVSSIVADYKRAKDELTMAYEDLVKILTMDKNIVLAKFVRDELRGLTAPTPSPAPILKNAPNTVEGVWRWGKHVMVFYVNGTAKEFFPDKGGNPLIGKWNATAEKEVILKLDNGFVVVCTLTTEDEMLASCTSSEGRTHEVKAKKISKTSSLWRWFNGGFVELCGDGCVNGDPTFRWRKDADRVIIIWPKGWVDTLALSPDGSQLSGRNQNGVPVSGELIR
jgi:hypothetical protein